MNEAVAMNRWRKSGDPSTYHYCLVRASKDAPWRVQQAWRTALDGRMTDEYRTP